MKGSICFCIKAFILKKQTKKTWLFYNKNACFIKIVSKLVDRSFLPDSLGETGLSFPFVSTGPGLHMYQHLFLLNLNPAID